MSQTKEKSGVSRRRFLIGAGSGAAGVAAAQALTATPAAAYDPGTNETRARYRLSEEVKTFYRVNGYERGKL